MLLEKFEKIVEPIVMDDMECDIHREDDRKLVAQVEARIANICLNELITLGKTGRRWCGEIKTNIVPYTQLREQVCVMAVSKTNI